jgi:hypothetical protein
MADTRAPETDDADNDQEPTGRLRGHATAQRPVESRLFPVEGTDRRLGDVRQRKNPFGRTSARRRQ